MHVLATAGHVDHGKSTLVRALTGMEPDRWAQERRRGMTIDLGFAWTSLPSGQVLAFVDVPGHHRFVANMLAGVGPVPAVLLVVAADEGWRRQSAEHLAAIDALDVRHGLLTVTRCDLAEPGPATEQALAACAGTSLGRVDAVAVSGRTGDGLPQLRNALDRLVASLPAPVVAGRVRLWVDRAFTIHGAGTVVTGTLAAGTLHVGDELELSPDGRRVPVRGLQTLGRAQDEVSAVARVAVNLRGVDLADVRRGQALVTPADWRAVDEADVRVSVSVADLPSQLVLHIGSASVPAHVRPLGLDTARLRLRTPLPLRAGDRALLRDAGRHRIAAGLVVLDVAPPSLRRRGAAAGRAAELTGMTGLLDPVAEVLRRGALRRDELATLGDLQGDAGSATRAGAGEARVTPQPPADAGTIVTAAEWLVAPEVWRGWATAVEAAVTLHARNRPLEIGVSAEWARRAAGIPDLRLLDALVARAPSLQMRLGRVCRAGAAPSFSPPVAAALQVLEERLRANPFDAPERLELEAAGLTPKVLAAAAAGGRLLRLTADVVLLPAAEEESVRRLGALTQPFTASQARQCLQTSRRVTIPLLEYLDGKGRTRRVDGQTRVLLQTRGGS